MPNTIEADEDESPEVEEVERVDHLCRECRVWFYEDESGADDVTLYCGTDCEVEATTDWRHCVECGARYDFDSHGAYDDMFCCYDCYDSNTGCDDDDGDGEGGHLHSYSFTPALNFLSGGWADPDENKLHLGIELEVPTARSRDFAGTVYDGPGGQDEVLYCKEDGSITGVEIVTHPMTHAYFRHSFPFGIFAPDSPQTALLSGRTPGTGYGLHVHVSRTGFKTESHRLRWLLLIYRNADQVRTLARRDSTEWGGFTDASRCEEKAAGDRSGARYVAVNAQNEATYEVRVFRSTWSEREFRAAVDFVHAGVIYTRDMTAIDAIDGKLDWDAFRSWVNTRREYVHLANQLRVDAGEPEVPVVADVPEPEPALYKIDRIGGRHADTLYLAQTGTADGYVHAWSPETALRNARQWVENNRRGASTLDEWRHSYDTGQYTFTRINVDGSVYDAPTPTATPATAASVAPAMPEDGEIRYSSQFAADEYQSGGAYAIYNAPAERWIVAGTANAAREAWRSYHGSVYGRYSRHTPIPSHYVRSAAARPTLTTLDSNF